MNPQFDPECGPGVESRGFRSLCVLGRWGGGLEDNGGRSEEEMESSLQAGCYQDGGR